MRFQGKPENQEKARQIAERILDQFKSGQIEEALTQVFIHAGNRPCDSWSFMNQFIMVMNGHSEARTFKAWREVGRQVRKGEKSFHILAPCTFRKRDNAGNPMTNDEGKPIFGISGFRVQPEFGYDQTDPIPGWENPYTIGNDSKHFDHLPEQLKCVVEAWDIKLTAYNGAKSNAHGWYTTKRDDIGHRIGLGVKNISTFAHELMHAADDRLGKLEKKRGQYWKSEIVAELGGAILLRLLGYERDADLGGCWEYVNSYAKQAELEPVEACRVVLERTCKGVALILTEAEKNEACEVADAA